MDKEKIFIIPQPVDVRIKPGMFILSQSTTIKFHSSLKQVGMYLANLLSISTGSDSEIKINNSNDDKNNAIILQIDSNLKEVGQEGYILNVSNDHILISALKPAGVFYGIQSLRQLLPIEIETQSSMKSSYEYSIQNMRIEDYPRFSWRGFMLDESRHFLGKVVVKRVIDLMALHKLNVFHWHLTDDQGWRIEIKKYPNLVSIGSKRNKTQVGGIKSFILKKFDTSPHFGHYSQQELKEIISYANERFITIIPEIDMPGHSMAALASYSELSCTKGPFNVQTTFGIKKDVFCPGKEQVFLFLQDILDEVINIFPSKIIHTGGDEVPKDRWRECPDCQVRMKDENCSEEAELQNYFTNRIAEYLATHGKILMGWNDILANNLNKDAITQHWLHGKNKVLDHLRRGRKLVMSDFFHTYLDYDYNLTPLRKTYNFEPIPQGLQFEFHKNVLGVEAPLWTEWVTSVKRFDWQVFPRLSAIAEIGWTSINNRDYKVFKHRLFHFLKRLRYLGIQHAKEDEIDPNNLRRIFSSSMILRSIFFIYSLIKNR